MDEASDLLVAMCERQEHRLELRRRKVDALVQHATEEAREPTRVRTARARVVCDVVDAEKERQHRADPVDAGGNTRGPDGFLEPFLDQRAELLEALVCAVHAPE